MRNKYTAKSISNFIIKNYPQSCMAYNIKDVEEYSDRKLLVECRDFFREIIGLCGCGNPTIVDETICGYLEMIEHWKDEVSNSTAIFEAKNTIKKLFGVEYISDNGLLLFMAYILADKNITEHGSSINWSWLTDLGEMYLYVLKNADLEVSIFDVE